MCAVFILLHSFLSSPLMQEICVSFMYLRFGSEFGAENIKRFNRVTATRSCWRLPFLKHQY